MKITLDPEAEKRLSDLLEALDENISVADIYNDILLNFPSFIQGEELKSEMNDFHLKENEAYFKMLMDKDDIDYKDPGIEKMAGEHRMKDILRLDDSFRMDPYMLNIRIPQLRLGNWSLSHNFYAPYESFIYQDVSLKGPDFKEVTSLGYFDKEYPYPIAMQGGQVWMSITPHEIMTMAEPIKEAKGDVLAFGLGLGYFPYMCSLKDEVKTITIVERDRNIIYLFEKFILPQFAAKDKIRIVKADAFDFAEHHLEGFDFVFTDLWHSEEDGLLSYMRMKKQARRYPQTVFAYWIEESMLVMLRRCLLSLLQEEKAGSTDEDYQKAESDTDRAMNILHFALRNREVKTAKDLDDLLSDSSLKAILQEA
jgi:hypothetical protein